MPNVQPIPADYPRAMPYLIIDGAAEAIEFYKTVLGADERMRMGAPGDKIGHAELQLGNSILMMADEYPDVDALGPKTIGGTPVTIHTYVEDVDAVFASALANGAKQLREPRDEFYGDRLGTFEDPWGHRWSVASHIEDVPPDEMQRRMEQAESEAA